MLVRAQPLQGKGRRDADVRGYQRPGVRLDRWQSHLPGEGCAGDEMTGLQLANEANVIGSLGQS